MEAISSTSPITFERSSPCDSLLSKLAATTICSETATVKGDTPLPQMTLQESSKFHQWIHATFFVTNKKFQLPHPVSVHSTVTYAFHEMIQMFNVYPSILLNGGAPPYFLPMTYLHRVFHLLGVAEPAEFFTEEILRPLLTLPKDFDIKFDVPTLGNEAFKCITGCFDRYLSWISGVDPETIKKYAYTKRVVITKSDSHLFITGLKGDFDLDLVIVKVAERARLFSHEFNLNITPLFFYNAVSVPIVEGGVQALIYRLARVLHIENPETINEYGWPRALSYITKGWRSFQEEAMKIIRERAKQGDLTALLRTIYSSHHNGPSEALALLFNTKVFDDFQENIPFDTSPIASPLGSKIREMLPKVPFNLLRSYLLFRASIQCSADQKLEGAAIETTLFFNDLMIQIFITAECCLALPLKPASIAEEQAALLEAPEEVIKHLLELEELFSPLECEIKRRTKCKGLEEEALISFFRRLHTIGGREKTFKKEEAPLLAETIVKRQQIDANFDTLTLIKTLISLKKNNYLETIIKLIALHPKTTEVKESDPQIKAFYEQVIKSGNEKLIQILRESSPNNPFLNKQDSYHLQVKVLIFDSNKDFRAHSIPFTDKIIAKTLEIAPHLQRKWELDDVLITVFLRAAFHQLERKYKPLAKMYEDYDECLIESKEIIAELNDKMFEFNYKLTGELFFNFDDYCKNGKNLNFVLKLIEHLLEWSRTDFIVKPLLMAFTFDLLFDMLEWVPAHRALLTKFSHDFIFTAPLKLNHLQQVHHKCSLTLFSLLVEHGFLSGHDQVKLALLLNCGNPMLPRKEADQLAIFSDLVKLITEQNSAVYLIRLSEVLAGQQFLFKKYPQKFVEYYQKVFECIAKHHELYLVMLKPVFEHVCIHLFFVPQLIGPFSCRSKGERVFAEQLFYGLFKATLSNYKAQITKKVETIAYHNVPKCLCEMIVEAEKRGLFDTSRARIGELLKEITDDINKWESMDLFKEDIDSVKHLMKSGQTRRMLSQVANGE